VELYVFFALHQVWNNSISGHVLWDGDVAFTAPCVELDRLGIGFYPTEKSLTVQDLLRKNGGGGKIWPPVRASVKGKSQT
jgi:hypothetical protein